MPIDQANAVRDARLAELHPQLDAALTGRSRVTLEVGCGHGHFLTAYAKAHPEEFCVGIDLLADRLARAGRKSRAAGLTNVAWIHAEAALLLEALPPSIRLGPVIFVLFPDPWPKRRHWKHRVIQPAFLSLLAARAEPGTHLCFRTDYAPYYTEAVATVTGHPDWVIDTSTPWPFEQPTVFQSRAESYQSLIARKR
ncbi:MAG TPA: methyltransferase domain-containing protein [Opitutaceae bacterium]